MGIIDPTRCFIFVIFPTPGGAGFGEFVLIKEFEDVRWSTSLLCGPRSSRESLSKWSIWNRWFWPNVYSFWMGSEVKLKKLTVFLEFIFCIFSSKNYKLDFVLQKIWINKLTRKLFWRNNFYKTRVFDETILTKSFFADTILTEILFEHYCAHLGHG